jgi:hypothetical protein
MVAYAFERVVWVSEFVCVVRMSEFESGVGE